ncbi:MAG: DoxX family protein, partial [Prolixibacteraceae bacterium]|nr:DoxX family protein [Burkholderiales bacterium]
MSSKGLPMIEVLLVLTIIIELGGGLTILLGWKARWAALVIFLFLIPVTLIFHAFWAVVPAQMQRQFNNCMTIVAIMGGMLYILAYG